MPRRIALLAVLLASFTTADAGSGCRSRPMPWRSPSLLTGDGCVVQVRFYEVGHGLHHAYILTSDRRGTTHFRAGPSRPGQTAERIRAFLGLPGARSWGRLVAEHGDYVR